MYSSGKGNGDRHLLCPEMGQKDSGRNAAE